MHRELVSSLVPFCIVLIFTNLSPVLLLAHRKPSTDVCGRHFTTCDASHYLRLPQLIPFGCHIQVGFLSLRWVFAMTRWPLPSTDGFVCERRGGCVLQFQGVLLVRTVCGHGMVMQLRLLCVIQSACLRLLFIYFLPVLYKQGSLSFSMKCSLPNCLLKLLASFFF